jgi:putative NADPH-quinone reductase
MAAVLRRQCCLSFPQELRVFGLLNICGVKSVKISVFTPVKSSDEAKRKKWIEEVKILGENEK